MPRPERKKLIEELEAKRESRVLCYVTGDRGPTPAQVSDDALRPIYDQLRTFGHVKKLDLFLYSRGGATDVPWRIVTALREASDEWNVLIPFRAHSAATMIALGADNIVLGRHGELGPIDPSLTFQRVLRDGNGTQTAMQDNVSVEDAMAYVKFVQDRVGLSDQTVLADSLGKLTERIDAVTLGNLYRTHSHIRDVARRILLSRAKPLADPILARIVETLAERVYAHGHAIGLADALELGLTAQAATDEVDAALWRLLEAYETDLKLREPLDAAGAVAKSSPFEEKDAVTVVVESASAVYQYKGTIVITARRQMPANLNVQISNVSLQFPSNVQAQNLPAAAQQAVQQQMQQLLAQAQQTILQLAQQAVTLALQSQAPIVALDAAFRDARWEKSA
jgi:ClpP class serine protease